MGTQFLSGDDASMAGLPAVKQSDLTKEEWARYANDGYEGRRINWLLKDGFSGDDIRTFTRKGVGLEQVKSLRSKGVSAYDVRHYVREGVDLKRVKTLRKQGFSPEKIRWYADHGGDAYVKRVSVRQRDATRVGDGATLRQVGKLERQGVPKQHIEHYVEHGTSLQLVSYLTKKDWSPKKIKYGVKTLKGGQTVAGGLAIYGDIDGWCEMNATNSPICQVTIQSTPGNATDGSRRSDN